MFSKVTMAPKMVHSRTHLGDGEGQGLPVDLGTERLHLGRGPKLPQGQVRGEAPPELGRQVVAVRDGRLAGRLQLQQRRVRRGADGGSGGGGGLLRRQPRRAALLAVLKVPDACEGAVIDGSKLREGPVQRVGGRLELGLRHEGVQHVDVGHPAIELLVVLQTN